MAENEEQSRDEPEPGPSGRNANLPPDEVSEARDPNPVERQQVPTDGAGASNSAPRDGPTPSQCPDNVGAAIAGPHSQLSNVWIDPVAPYVVLGVTKTE